MTCNLAVVPKTQVFNPLQEVAHLLISPPFSFIDQQCQSVQQCSTEKGEKYIDFALFDFKTSCRLYFYQTSVWVLAVLDIHIWT